MKSGDQKKTKTIKLLASAPYFSMAHQLMPPLSSLHLSGEGQNKNKNNKNRIILATKYAQKTKIKIDDGDSRRKIKLPKNGRGAPKCHLTPGNCNTINGWFVLAPIVHSVFTVNN
jgi:hypothetical protein